ncbi:MAG: hypothetical protein AAF402_12230 [Pseudomonadota bacterium]
MSQQRKIFYQFLGLHSLLIGIFPFFIPVFLWKQGFDLGRVCLFISLAGIGFCIGLWIWDRIRGVISLTSLIAISLVFEILLLVNVQMLDMDFGVMLLLGISYGVYNSFFWTTQRALFFELIDISSSGRKYGNIQIFVGLLLQIGILIGGFLLERADFDYLLIVCGIIAGAGFILLCISKPRYPQPLVETRPVSITEIFKFRDGDSSRFIFIVDGLFLFLESFFWVISLFLLSHESFTTLGLIVMSLAIIFGLLFYLLKNTIDRLGRRKIYTVSVLLYASSWALRAVTGQEMELIWLFVLLVMITFCTSFFRLAMNKRFYDVAKQTIQHPYLVLKSYYSQMTIATGFAVLGWLIIDLENSEKLFSGVYWGASALALSFLAYGASRYRQA